MSRRHATRTLCATPGCGGDSPEHAFICPGCSAALARDLGDIPALVDDLTTTLVRLDRLGSGGGRRGAETALPYHEGASEVLRLLDSTVGTWARDLAEHTGAALPATSTAAAARWLLCHLESLAMTPQAGEAVVGIAEAVTVAYRVIDRRPELLPAGVCGWDDCEALLLASPTATVITCRRCGAHHEAADRRAWMMASAAQVSVTATVALGWVTLLTGWVIPGGTWRSWLSRGELVAEVGDHVGRPLYRWGDVHALALRWAAIRQERGSVA